MSVGNINSYGDKKNNFPFQYKVLKGISDTVTALVAGITVNINPQLKTPRVLREAGNDGTIFGLVKSISFANTGTADAIFTIDGNSNTIKPGETISFDAGSVNNYFGDGVFGYDTTQAGAELLIIYII